MRARSVDLFCQIANSPKRALSDRLRMGCPFDRQAAVYCVLQCIPLDTHHACCPVLQSTESRKRKAGDRDQKCQKEMDVKMDVKTYLHVHGSDTYYYASKLVTKISG